MLDPRQEYSNRLALRLQTLAAKDRLHARIGNLKLVVVLTGILLAYLSLSKDLFSGYWVVALLGVYLALALAHELVIRAKTRASAAAGYYRQGIARIEDRWPGTGQSGDRFRTEDHVYAFWQRQLVRAAFDRAASHGRESPGGLAATAVSQTGGSSPPGIACGTPGKTGSSGRLGYRWRKSTCSFRSGILDRLGRARA